jgi:hypothetical protein
VVSNVLLGKFKTNPKRKEMRERNILLLSKEAEERSITARKWRQKR